MLNPNTINQYLLYNNFNQVSRAVLFHGMDSLTLT